MKTNTWILGSAILASALGVAACDGDDTTSPTPVSDAGPDATASDGGSTTDAAGATDAGPDGAEDAAAPAADAGDAAAPAYALFVGTDFKSSELSAVSLDTDSVSGNFVPGDEDVAPYTSGGYGFVLERSRGGVLVLDSAQPWTVSKTIDVNPPVDAGIDAGTYASNPYAVIMTTGTKGYVVRYGLNALDIVDVAAGTVTNSIDLSSFMATDDPDGVIEATDGAYDPVAKRAYILLERINNDSYPLACIASHGVIVGIDATTDTVVDLNGAAAGDAIDLIGYDAVTLNADFADGRLLVGSAGCLGSVDAGAGVDGGTAEIGMGIEAVTIASASSAWLYEPTGTDSFGGLVWVDTTHAYVNNGSIWFAWDPSTAPTAGLGAAVPNFPGAPSYDGNGHVIGLTAQLPDAGSDAGLAWSAVSFSTATSEVSTIVAAPFKTVEPDPDYGIFSAVLP